MGEKMTTVHADKRAFLSGTIQDSLL